MGLHYFFASVMLSEKYTKGASTVSDLLQSYNFDKATKSGNPFGHRLSPFWFYKR
jgi:cytoplasmic iron level regulating protein YaaA (DUF328/UPF0246 family)